jgi:hypothetical protein
MVKSISGTSKNGQHFQYFGSMERTKLGHGHVATIANKNTRINLLTHELFPGLKDH